MAPNFQAPSPEATTPEERFAAAELLFPATLIFVGVFYVVPLAWLVERVPVLLPWLGPMGSFLATMVALFGIVFGALVLARQNCALFWPAMPAVIARFARATGFPRRDALLVGLSILAAVLLIVVGAVITVPLALACVAGFGGLVTTATRDAWPVRRYHRRLPDLIPDYTPEEPEPTDEDVKAVTLEWEFKRDGLVPVTGEVQLRIRQRDWEAAVECNPYARGERFPYDDVNLERLLELFVIQGTTREVRKIAYHLLAMARHHQFSVYEELCNALAAVHAVRYRLDEDAFGRGEYWRFPIETLYPLEGDCEDSALLLLALLKALFLGHPNPSMNRDLMFLIVGDDPKSLHAAVAVEGSGDFPAPAYFAADGKLFFYCEATGTDWRVGDVPPNVGSIRARIRLRDPLRKEAV